MKITAQSLNPT